MPTKTPGGLGASEKFQKQAAEKHGLGAENASGRTQGDTIDKTPGNAAVASDSGDTNVGVEAGTSATGERGISGVPVDSAPQTGGANMKS